MDQSTYECLASGFRAAYQRLSNSLVCYSYGVDTAWDEVARALSGTEGFDYDQFAYDSGRVAPKTPDSV